MATHSTHPYCGEHVSGDGGLFVACIALYVCAHARNVGAFVGVVFLLAEAAIHMEVSPPASVLWSSN